MAGGISLHAVDVASGRPAVGMQVEIVALRPAEWPSEAPIAEAALGAGGALDHPVVRGEGVRAGTHEARFHVGEWLRAQGLAQGPVFMEIAVFRFEVLDVAEHVHLPLKFTRWGVALFRGA
jgi:5-hydroxyisourate hydrolase